MIDRKFIGYELPTHSAAVEAGRLRFFAKATGQTNPVYTDLDKAHTAGYRSLPVPPTFLVGLEMDTPNPFQLYEDMDVDIRNVLHGEQRFEYHNPACAGDTLTFASRIKDIYEKKGGALEFIVQETRVTNQDGALVANLHRVTIVRN